MAPRTRGAAVLAAVPVLLPLALGQAELPLPPTLAPAVAAEDAGCEWPNCTNVCDECHAVPFTTCLVSLGSLNGCGPNADCSSRLCHCNEGYCHFGSTPGCMPKNCSEGATPPPYEPTDWSRSFASLGPVVPSDAKVQDWVNFALDTVHLPLVIFIAGLAIATFTCVFVSGTEEHTALDCLPSTPYCLVVGSILAFLIVFFGILMRHIAMVQVFGVAKGQLHNLHADIQIVSDHAQVLNGTCANLSVAFYALPESCDHAVVFSSYAMQKLVDKGGVYVNQVVTKVAAVTAMLRNLEGKIRRAEDFSGVFENVLLAVPIFPVICMFVVTVAIVVVALVSWCHHDPKVADEADDAFFRYGGCCIFTLIVTTGLLAAVYLWTGISEGALCLDVDHNIVAIVDDLNFTAYTNMSAATDKTIDQTFEHYILGTVPNPLLAKIAGIKNQLDGLNGVYNNAKEIMTAAEDICTEFQKFNVPEVIVQVESALNAMENLIHASNVWPYYQAIMHNLICGSLVESQGYLVFINVIVGLIFFPILAVIAHADLDRWSHWKSQNGRGSRGRGQRPPRGFLSKSKRRDRDAQDVGLLASDGGLADGNPKGGSVELECQHMLQMQQYQQYQQMQPMQPMQPMGFGQPPPVYPVQPGPFQQPPWQGSMANQGYMPVPAYSGTGYQMGQGQSARNLQVQPLTAQAQFARPVGGGDLFPSPVAGWAARVPGD